MGSKIKAFVYALGFKKKYICLTATKLIYDFIINNFKTL